MVLSSFRVSEREKKSSQRPSTFMEVALKKFYSASRQPYQLQNARRNVMLMPKIFLLSGLHNCALNNKSNSACYNSATHHYVAIKLSGKRQVPYNRLWSVTVGCRCQNGNRADICLIDNHKNRHYKYINEHTSI